MILIAKGRGGRCLSKRYLNSITKLRWQCQANHIWWATPSHIDSGRWCPKCGRKRAADLQRGTIEQMVLLAQKNGGKCLSKKYVNNHTKLLWQCHTGHEWQVTPADVASGYWCPHCAGNIKQTIEMMRNLARKRGGKCLSRKYVNSQTKLFWQCHAGHKWQAKPTHITSGQWCSTCSAGISERICRYYFEKIFRTPFPKLWPQWLKGKIGRPLQLDGYSEKRHVAFEYQGAQHFQKIPHLQQAFKLKKIREHDAIKRRQCKQHGVTLIEVPYTVPHDQIADFIIRESRQRSISFPKIVKIYPPSIRNLGVTQKVEELKRIAKSRGGALLSMTYLGSNTKHEWRCAEGHLWDAIPMHVKRGSWCPYCAGNFRRTIEEMRDIARNRGGRCISTTYLNCQSKLLWQCRAGHKWQATPNNIKNGRWCPTCGHKGSGGSLRGSIKQMTRLARKNKGKCLSQKYVNSITKLRWQCKEGHTWSSRPSNISNGRWCPTCAIRMRANLLRGTIKEMNQVAQMHEGRCLSKIYVNDRTKLRWQCKKGHIWRAVPSNIKIGEWCPTCGHKRGGELLRGTIKQMTRLARKNKGKCLSQKYVNSTTKLRWQCKEGHTWWTTPTTIQSGSWCPPCAIKKKVPIYVVKKTYLID